MAIGKGAGFNPAEIRLSKALKKAPAEKQCTAAKDTYD